MPDSANMLLLLSLGLGESDIDILSTAIHSSIWHVLEMGMIWPSVVSGAIGDRNNVTTVLPVGSRRQVCDHTN